MYKTCNDTLLLTERVKKKSLRKVSSKKQQMFPEGKKFCPWERGGSGGHGEEKHPLPPVGPYPYTECVATLGL